MLAWRTISSVSVDIDSTWVDSAFLTFDIDWAHDEVLHDAIALVEQADVSATWFVTHDTSALERLRANPKFELGIHPNFNGLLQGDLSNGRNACEVIERLAAIVPEATAVRSHSMAQSSVLLDIFRQSGLTHDANHFVPFHAGIELKPWRLWNGLTRVPYGWEDDVHCAYGSPDGMAAFANRPGLKVFDFHPIHVFLNTERLDRYERSRRFHQDPGELIGHRYDGYGTRTRLMELLQLSQCP